MKKNLLGKFLVMLLLLSNVAWAQERVVSGKVTSTEDGTALPGVNVVIKGTGTGTATDINGNYKLSVPEGATLAYSFLGFLSNEVAVGTKSTIDVQLETDITQLSEIVVTGYGSAEKRTISGAISSVKGSAIENLPVQSFDRALQGRAAGVQVLSNNGIPGGGVTIRIRGTGSISAGNAPLYIVDGVQVNSRNDATATQSNPLAFLNPNDIASMEVLKDAASAAIYGAQAANGVVIITTKKGKSGKPALNFSYYTGSSQPLKLLKVTSSQDWFNVRKEARLNAGETEINAVANTLNDMGRRPSDFATRTVQQLYDVAAGLPTYDWQKEVFKNGKVSNYELSFSGGDDKNKYYISGSYNDQTSILAPVDFKRGTVKVDLTNTLSPKLKLATSVNLSSFNQNVPFAVSGSFLGSPAFSSSAVLPHNPIYNEDGSYNTAIAGVLGQNVVQVNAFNTGYSKSNQVVGSMTFTYDIMKGLYFKSLFGLDYRSVAGEQYRDPRTPDGVGVNGRSSQQNFTNSNFITTQTLNYSKSIDNTHNFSALAGVEYRTETFQSFVASKTGFPTFQYRYINAGAVVETVDGNWSGFARVSGFAQLTYDFKKKYTATFTARRDGSSRFGTENRYGLFKSVSAAWIAKEEDFLKNVNFLTDLKLRISYGETGNDDIGDFAARALYTGGTNVNYNGTPGIRPSGLANPKFSWETNQTVNAGLDLALFDSRVELTVDAYRRTSKDLLLFRPTPWVSGYDSYADNVGEVINQGIEFELRTVNLDWDGFTWRTDFNYSFNRNYVNKLFDDLQELPGNPTIRVGYPISTFFAQQYAGVNPATGRPAWYDINNNITYLPTAADRRTFGSRQARSYGGLTNTFSYKGISVEAFFNYEYGRTVIDAQYNFLRENGTRLTLNALQETADARWTTPGQITQIPRPYTGGTELRGSGVTLGSATYLKSDFIRLKQVTVSYNLPTTLISRLRLVKARVYAQGVNLWTYADYPGYDPEFVDFDVASATGNNGVGLLPQSRNYTVGVQLGF